MNKNKISLFFTQTLRKGNKIRFKNLKIFEIGLQVFPAILFYNRYLQYNYIQ